MRPHPALTLTTLSFLLAAASQAAIYQWAGTTSSDWTVGGNWIPTSTFNAQSITAGPAPTGATFAHRLNINNSTANPAIYTAAQGATVYANTAASSRGLVIGSGTGNGNLTITGGSFSTLGSTAGDVMGNSPQTGGNSLTINGGAFISTNFGFAANFGSSTTNVITVTSGSATFATLTLSLSATGSATLNLDGGTTSVNLINRTGAGQGILNWNGGTLKARQANAAFVSGLTSVNVKSGGAVADSNGFDVTVSQALLDGAGGGGLTKNSAGLLTLGGNNTYTGATTINAGGLQLGTGGASGSLGAGAIVNNGTGLIISRTGSLILNNTISGTGGLTQNGTVTTTLGGANTYTGATTVNGGRLDLTGSLTSPVAVNNAALGGEGSTTGAVTFTGTSGLSFDPNTPGALSVASADLTGATLVLTPTTAGSGSNLVALQSAGAITGFAGNVSVVGRGSASLSGDSKQILVTFTPASLVWTGDGANPTFWDTATGNFLNGAATEAYVAGDNATFNDSAVTFGVAVQGVSLLAGNTTFNNSVNAYTLSGGSLAGGGTLTKTGTNSLTLAATNTYAGGTVINGGSINTAIAGALGSGGVTVGASGTLNLTGGGLAYSGVSTGLGGSGVVNVTLGTGVATTTFNGSNSAFTGTLNLGVGAGAGDGKAQINGALGAGATVNVLPHATVYVSAAVTHPASLVLNGGDTGESLGQLRLESGAVWSGPVSLAGDVTGTGDGAIGSNTGIGTISGVISETGGSRSLAKVGAGRIALTGANTYSGPTNISNGALVVSVNGALGTAANGTVVANAATLALSGDVNYANAETVSIVGPGSLTASYFLTGSNVQRGAIQSVTGSNTFAGNIIVDGTGNNTRIGVQDGAQLTLTGNITESVAGSILSFRHGNTAGSNIILSGTGSWTGDTQIFGGGGAVILGSATALPSGSILRIGTTGIAGNSTLDLNGFSITVAGLSQLTTVTGGIVTNNGATASALTLNPPVDNTFFGVVKDGTSAVSIIKTGAGIQKLSGTNTYTGTTTISGGFLHIGSGGTVGTLGTGAVVNNATLTVNRSDALSLTNNISGTGALVKDGAGVLTLTGARTYTGNTTVNAGTLSVNSASFADASTVTLATGAFLDLAFTGADTVASLVVNGVPLASGTYNATTSPAFITGTGSLTIPDPNPYAGWQTGKFTTEELGDVLVSGSNADPDGDGLSNALEYAFGTEPKAPSSGFLPQSAVSSGQLALSYLRPVGGVAGVTYTVQTVSDLQTGGAGWADALPADFTQTTSTVGVPAGYEKVTVTFNTAVSAGEKKFSRIFASF